MASYSLIRVTTLENSKDKIIFLWKHPGMIARWFGAKPEILRFRGRVTVWHDAETGKRAGTMMESLLSDFDTKDDWERGQNG